MQFGGSLSSPAPAPVRVRGALSSRPAGKGVELPPRGTLVAAAHGMSLGFSSLAVALNGVLLAALLCRRVRERCSGILVLTGAELALNLIAMTNMLAQILFNPDSVPEQLGQCMQGAQMTRNWWMLIVTAYRAVITARPQLVVGEPGRQFPAGLQLCLLAGAVALSIGECFAGEIWRLAVWRGNGGGNATTGAQTLSAMRAEMLRDIQFNLLKQINFVTLGVLLPALGVVCIAARIAYCLRTRYSNHRATRRAAGTILLLALVFVALELPYAASIAGTCAYLLRFCGSREQMLTAYGTIHLMEKLSSWGSVVVPINSCMNFFILLRYSRSFRRLLAGRPGHCCRRWRRHRLRRRLHREQLDALAQRQGMQTWQSHRAAAQCRQQQQLRQQEEQHPGNHRCEAVVMIENVHVHNHRQ